MTQQTFSDPAAAQLAQAAKSGDAARIRELVAGGANPNARGDNGTTMLQWAMLQQSRSGFEALLAAGADPALGDDDGLTAVHLAAQADTPYWLETLLAGGASPDTPNTVTRATPLMAALMTERGANAQRLLDAGAQVDAIDRQHNTALHVAAKINQMDWVLKLLDAGASPGAVNAQGVTFQRYLFMTRDATLNASARRERDAVREWLRGHNVPIEDASAQ
ncbi:ankyrin repeat domain-containing protein [Luteimonas soli]|uniref:Ankyrin repeat domain-containing protein n=1 Tax=Luteimonas soli TaxID=1648966 RepID=A0ABV7XN77_9GAMM